MLQKEEKIVVVLLGMAVLSLIIGYFGFSEEMALYSPDSKLGERVYADGAVLSKQMTKTGDNLILKVSDIDAIVFIQKNNGAKELFDSVKVGERIRITGKVEEYKDSREIVVENANGIKTL
jgi:DNA/RNA endonuclease YhcR with UshA esterase domain